MSYLLSSTCKLMVSFIIAMAGPLPAQVDRTNEEYKVYSAVLKAEHEANKPKTVVITKVSSPNMLILPGSDDQKNILKTLSPLTQETLDNYNHQNKTQQAVIDKFDITAKAILVDQNEVYEIFSQGDLRKNWETFYKKFPNSDGLISFSRVGFDPNRKQALVFVSHQCGGLCASGTYFLLERENDAWKITKDYLVWVS